MSTPDPSFELLGRCGLFSGLDPKVLKAIHASGKEIRFGAGEAFIKEGEEGGRFFLLLDGEAEVWHEGKDKPVATLGCGDVVGEISLIDGEPRTATVVATGAVRAFTLVAWNFKAVLREHPEAAERVMLFLARRLRDAQAPGCE